MDCLLERRSDETMHGILHLQDGSNVPFLYKEESRRKYEEFNTFIQGMEFVTATATISTTTRLAIAYNDKITLDNGITLLVKRFEPVVNERRALLCRDSVERWIIDLR